MSVVTTPSAFLNSGEYLGGLYTQWAYHYAGATVGSRFDDRVAGKVKEFAPNAKIGVTFDPHSHLSQRRVQNADIITVFKEFPHTDFVRTGEDCVRLTLAALTGEITPVISTFDCKMIEVLDRKSTRLNSSHT